jgi:hypothetical protein
MNKKIVIVGAIGLVVLTSFIVLTNRGKKQAPTESSAEQVVDNAETNINNNSGIVVPENIKQITAEDWAKYENANCSNEPMDTICEYYIQTKNETNEKSTKNLEWNSFCAYVRKYKGGDSFDTGSYHYETLGYETTSCHQGMYQK